MFKNAREKCSYVKSHIQDKIEKMLGTYVPCQLSPSTHVVPTVSITGTKDVKMQWVNYDRDIVQKFSIKLVGWTHSKFASPSTLGSNLGKLIELRDAIDSGNCQFVRITEQEKKKHKVDWAKKVADGEVTIPKSRARKASARKDITEGHSGESSDDDQEDEMHPPKRQRVVSKEFIDDSDE